MKKIISLVLVLVLALTAIGGTLAYFTDTDEAENVFTVGNISIRLDEDYTGTDFAGTKDYEEWLEKQTIMPGTSVDKIVSVTNTGAQPAYIRVIITIPADMEPVWRTGWENDWGWSEVVNDDGSKTHTFQLKNPLAKDTSTAALLEKVTLNGDVTVLDAQASYVVPVKVEAIQANGLTYDTAYAALTDALASTVEVSNQTGLENAISSAAGQTNVDLGAGTYTLPSVAGKEIAISGNKDTIIDMTNASAVGASGAEVMFDGVTIDAGTKGYNGLQHSDKVVYRNCTIVGTQFLYAPNVNFINCTFEMVDANTEYSIWTYGATDVTFTGCTFNTNGKAVLVYTEGETHANINLTDCKFTSTGTYNDKAAVEVGASAYSADTTYNLTFKDCTQTGFAANKSDNALWGNKNEMDKNHLNVIIDGKDVY